MDLTLLGYHVVLGWNIHISGPDFDFQLSSLLALLVIALIALFCKSKHGKKKGDEGLWLTFGGSEKSRGRCSSYGDAVETLGRFRKRDTVVAVIDIEGIILDEKSTGLGPLQRLAGHATFGLELGNMLKRIAECESLGAVWVRESTPGGTIPGARCIFDGLRACAEKGKPVYCYVQNLAASGGVWTMVGADHIIAHPNAILGSIGVIGPSLKRYRGVTRMGGIFGQQVEAREITSRSLHVGEGKNFGDPFAEPDEESIASFMDILERSYDHFVQHVSRCRSIEVEQVRSMGARLLSADKALEVGLIDSIGDHVFAQNALAEKLGVDWEDCKLLWIRPSNRKGPSLSFGSLTSSLSQGDSTPAESIVRAELSRHPVLALTDWNNI